MGTCKHRWNSQSGILFRKMTLHEAIEKLLKEKGRSMTTSEITEELNHNKWHTKKDGSETCQFQVHGRTHSFAKLFNRDGAYVSLKKQDD
jgi:hypothetical protein